jgi:hypothetical protein
VQTNACRIRESLGRVEACPGEPCPFWDRGACALEALDLRSRPELAEFLSELRGELESARDVEDAAGARRRFFQRLNAGRAD